MDQPIELLQATYKRYSEHPEQLDADANQDARINRDDVLHDMATHAERYLHWARLAAVANITADRAKAFKERTWAECCTSARAILSGRNDKITDSRVTETAATLEPFLLAQDQYLKARGLFLHLAAIEETMRQRHALIQSMNSRQCRELGFMVGQHHNPVPYREAIESQVGESREPTLSELQEQYHRG